MERPSGLARSKTDGATLVLRVPAPVPLVFPRACDPRRSSLQAPKACAKGSFPRFCLSQSQSGRRDSNPRHSAWEADILPLNYTRLSVSDSLPAADRSAIPGFRPTAPRPRRRWHAVGRRKRRRVSHRLERQDSSVMVVRAGVKAPVCDCRAPMDMPSSFARVKVSPGRRAGALMGTFRVARSGSASSRVRRHRFGPVSQSGRPMGLGASMDARFAVEISGRGPLRIS